MASAQAKGVGDRIFKLGSDTTAEYGRFVKSR